VRKRTVYELSEGLSFFITPYGAMIGGKTHRRKGVLKIYGTNGKILDHYHHHHLFYQNAVKMQQ